MLLTKSASKSETPQTTVADIKAKLPGVRLAVETARDKFQMASLGVEDGQPNAAAALAAARTELQSAEAAFASLEAALKAATARDAIANQGATESERVKRCQQLREIARKRKAAAVVAEQAARTMAAAYAEVIELGTQLHSTAPVPDDKYLTSSVLNPADITKFFRIDLKRAGLQWEGRFWVWPVEDALGFVEKIEETNRFILSLNKV